MIYQALCDNDCRKCWVQVYVVEWVTVQYDEDIQKYCHEELMIKYLPKKGWPKDEDRLLQSQTSTGNP